MTEPRATVTELHRDRAGRPDDDGPEVVRPGGPESPVPDDDRTDVLTGPGRPRPTGPTTVRKVRPRPATAPATAPPKRRQPPPWLRSGPARAWVAGTSTSLTILAAVLLGFLVEVVIVGGLQHGRDQEVAFAQLREQLANGVAAVGPLDLDGNPVPKGTPVALLRMGSPELTEVVRSGTSADVLTGGVGHRRDTVLPGQAGVSVLMGRRNLFGGPFSGIDAARPGQVILVTTGQAKDLRFQVRGVRRAGDPLPPLLAQGRSRLTLVTTTGRPFAPDGLLYVDADLLDPTQDLSTPGFTPATLPADELPLGVQWRALTALTVWGALLMLGAIATSWLKLRWGRWQAWTVAVPTLGFLGIAVADAAARLLPNLL